MGVHEPQLSQLQVDITSGGDERTHRGLEQGPRRQIDVADQPNAGVLDERNDTEGRGHPSSLGRRGDTFILTHQSPRPHSWRLRPDTTASTILRQAVWYGALRTPNSLTSGPGAQGTPPR